MGHKKKSRMKAVFASALVAAATALPWEDSQYWKSYSPRISYGLQPKYELVDGLHQPEEYHPTSQGLRFSAPWELGRGDNNAVDVWGNLGWDYNAKAKKAYEFCSYFSPERVNGEEGTSPLETNMQMASVKIATDWGFDNPKDVDTKGLERINDQEFLDGLIQGPVNPSVTADSIRQGEWYGDDAMTATRSLFCKSCFGGDDVQTTARFCKSCFGGDVEVQARFCKSCFGGDDAEANARFCKSCFGGDDAEVKARFCRSCFGGDDSETRARFCKSCFGGDSETHARFCKSCFGGDAETQARFCKSCFGG